MQTRTSPACLGVEAVSRLLLIAQDEQTPGRFANSDRLDPVAGVVPRPSAQFLVEGSEDEDEDEEGTETEHDKARPSIHGVTGLYLPVGSILSTQVS